jgi:hypothetical protein
MLDDDIVCAWSAFWDGVIDWKWTPGWGNLLTVTVAIAAIGVSAWYNRRTLRSTNEKFIQGRVDARNDKLRVEIAGLLDAISERTSKWTVAAHRTSELTPQPLTELSGQSLRAAGQSLKAAWSELLSGSYTRIGTHALAVEILTDDPGIIAPVRRILEQGGAERQLLDTVLELLGSLTTPEDVSGLLAPFQQLLQIRSSNRIDLERQALVDYVIGEWAQQNR